MYGQSAARGLAIGGGDAGYAATTANVPTPARPTQIAESFAGLERNIEALHEVISRLEVRLTPILHPQPPQAIAKNTDAPPTPNTPLAGGLEEQARRINSAWCRLSDMESRIEL